MLRKFILAAALFALPATAYSQNPPKPLNLPTTNSSAAIATGNTFQVVLAASTGANPRNSLTIQNNNTSDSCWIFIGAGTASKAAAIMLLAGGSYTRYSPYIPSDVIQATCATSADTLYIDTQ